MDDREIEVAEIKARMRAMGYNQRSLSMKLFNKPDRLRNFFEGKSKNLKADAYKAIRSELWPEEKSKMPSTSFSDKELALLIVIQDIIHALAAKKIRISEDLESLFNYQLREFRARNQVGAAEVMDRLLGFVRSELPRSTPQEAHKSAPLAPDQSKIEKI